MSTPADKTKKLLHDKLQFANVAISKIMSDHSLTPEDKIAVLFTNIQERLKGIGGSDDVELIQLEDVYVNLIIGVMAQDTLGSDDQISRLTAAIGKRIEHFDRYFEQLEKGTLQHPF